MFRRIGKNVVKQDKTGARIVKKMSKRIVRDVKMLDKNVVKVEEKMFRKIVKAVRRQDKTADKVFAKMRKANVRNGVITEADKAIEGVGREVEIAVDSLVFHNQCLVLKSNSFSRYHL
jgi:hypothetical protein